MTSPYLIPDLKADEGCRLHAYPDPLSGGVPWTVGYGCTGQDIGPNTIWTQAQADDALSARVGTLITELARQLVWFTRISDLRQDVLVNMAYQLGLHGLMGFPHTLALVQVGDYLGASKAMLASEWAKQTPNRAKRLSQQMATNSHA